MKLHALACLAAAVTLSSAALAQNPTPRTAPGSSPNSTSGTRARGEVDTSTSVGNPVNTPKGQAPAGAAPAGAAPAASSDASSSQFKDEASAKSHCPSDAVVWVNLNSKAYHAAGTKYYGKTKNGAYECQKDADSDGFHAAGHKKTASAATTTTH